MMNHPRFIKVVLSTAFLLTSTFYTHRVCAADTVIAKVNGKDITISELNRLKAALPEQIRKQAKDENKLFDGLRDQLIDIQLVTEAALKSDINKKSEVQSAIEKSKEQVIVQAYLADVMKSTVSEKAMKDRYDQLVKDFPKNEQEARAMHILVDNENLATTLIKRLDNGEDFMKVARENSKDTASANNGGDLGYFTKATMIPEFATAAFQLKPNQYTKKPVKTQFGYHIIKLTDLRKLRPPKFEDVREQLANAVAQEEMMKFVGQLRTKAKIERFDKAGKPVKEQLQDSKNDSSKKK